MMTLSACTSAIYACALQPELWPAALHSVANELKSVGGLLIHRRTDGSFGTLVSPGLRHAVDVYERIWWRHDIRAERAMAGLYAEAAGAALTDRHLVSDEEIRTHPIYTEFLVPLGLMWAASVQVSPRSGAQVGLSVLRAVGTPPFSDADLAVLADLGRHAEQALRLGLRIVEAEAVNLGLGEALSRLSSGVFVVDGLRRVSFANARARRLSHTVFEVKDGLLGLRLPAHHKRLVALLGGVACGAVPQSPLVVANGPERLAIYVFPLEAQEVDWHHATGSCSVVLVLDLAPGAPLDPGLVRDVYGLTLGEARVAALVGAGISPREAARTLCLAEETVRSVLKRVFSKLDVCRQAELTDLFARLKTVR